MPLSGLQDWLRLVLMYRAPHPASQAILDVVEHLLDAPFQTHVLLHGEPGTGKEGLARGIHQAMHPGGSAPFVKMPTGGRDPDVLAVHLFGTAERRGAIARAEGGTLFLDEIGTLPREIQARLAPVLRGRYRRNDDEAPQPCEVCIIGATDHDLPNLVSAGSFRHDLYYRLSRIELTIPPLRERPDDIPRAALWAGNRLLGQHGQNRTLVREADGAPGGGIVLTEEAVTLLLAHAWPGNFRELDRAMERALFLFRQGDAIRARDVQRALGRS
ncbi:MAG: sigma 54-interacting transcriptional regulator [Myxococcota bacterium]